MPSCQAHPGHHALGSVTKKALWHDMHEALIRLNPAQLHRCMPDKILL